MRALGIYASLALMKTGIGEDYVWPERLESGWMIIAGAGLLCATGIYALCDILTASSSARKYNKSIKSNVYLMPKIDMKEKSYGLSFVYSF